MKKANIIKKTFALALTGTIIFGRKRCFCVCGIYPC